MPETINNILQIQFNEDIEIGGTVNIISERYQDGVGIGMPLNETWYELRNAPKRVTKGVPTAIPGERSAINYVTAFQLDYNSTGYFQITRTGNVVTIKGPNTDSSTNNFTGASATADALFTFSTEDTTIFDYSEIDFAEAAENPCSSVEIRVHTTQQASLITDPYNDTVDQNPFIFTVIRGTTFHLRMVDSNLLAIDTIVQTPSVLNADNFNLHIVNNPLSGGTVIVIPGEMYLIAPEYSLDGITWDDSNAFYGLENGQYTLYIRDQYGCEVQKIFFIGDVVIGARKKYLYISKAMSFRFAQRVEWGISSNYKNDENTLSCEVDVKLPYKEIQQFQSSDIITTQFKSSYSENIAHIVKEDGTQINIPVVQKTNNIDIKDKRDAIKIELENGTTGIYFQSGSTYDFDTDIPNGTYSLNGTLPAWGVVGNYITIDGAWYEISSVYFDELMNAEIIVIQSDYSGAPTNVVVGSVYNLFDYEVYEFITDLSNYINQDIQIKIYSNDNNFGEVTHLSEVINIKERQEGTLEIKYKNTENTDVLYSTGIVNLIRQSFNIINGKVDQETDTYKTDTNAKLLSAELYESDEFIFEPVTKEMMRKIAIALAHKEVSINGVGYVKNGEIEVEGPLEQSNLYVVKANMTKTDNVFTTDNIDGAGTNTNIEVPGLLSTEDGFIRHS